MEVSEGAGGRGRAGQLAGRGARRGRRGDCGGAQPLFAPVCRLSWFSPRRPACLALACFLSSGSGSCWRSSGGGHGRECGLVSVPADTVLAAPGTLRLRLWTWHERQEPGGSRFAKLGREGVGRHCLGRCATAASSCASAKRTTVLLAPKHAYC